MSHINVFELFVVLIAALRWGPSWSGSHVVVRTDNLAAMAAIIKGSSRSVQMMPIVCELFWLSVRHDFLLYSVHLPGKINVLADRILRLDVLESACEARYSRIF
jgi:hypothetical protein